MSSKFVYLEKYAVAPSPSRDYYGIKVVHDQVILHQWKIAHGPHCLPFVRITKFSDFNKDQSLKQEIQHVFGSKILDYVECITTNGANSLLTLPKSIVEKLVHYLNIRDIVKLFCVSTVSNEIFNTNSVWEILLKRSKRSSILTEMEKELGASQGFKKLVKEHHIRSAVKRHLKEKSDKSARSQKVSDSGEKIGRSSSVNAPKVTSQDDSYVTRKQSMDGIPRKAQKPLKTSTKHSNVAKDKKFDQSKKGTSAEKPSLFLGTENFMEKHAAGESCPIKATKPKTKAEKPEQRLCKYKFVNEKNESTEILMQKKYLKSAIAKSDFGDCGMDDRLLKTSIPKSPRLSLNKYSSHNLGEFRSKTNEKSIKHKNPRSTKNATTGNAGDETDYSDESGMSFLMKRYLAASEDVARKFSECERLARSTKGTQADIKAERKSVKKVQKHMSSVDKPILRNSGSTANIFSKLKSLKKN